MDIKKRKQILDHLFTHTKIPISNFLSGNGLKKSGNKTELRRRLEDALVEGVVDVAQVLSLIDDIEGWGRQHIFLYQSKLSSHKDWRNIEYVKKRLRGAGLLKNLNKLSEVFLPEQRLVSSISWSVERLKVVWVEQRVSYIRDPDSDAEEELEGETLFYRAYQKKISRSIYTFDWNLKNGNAMLLIRQLPQGVKYESVRDELLEEIFTFISRDAFKIIKVSKAIDKIESLQGNKTRSIDLETKTAGKIKIKSRNKLSDTNKDHPALSRARRSLGRDAHSIHGNFYLNYEEKGKKKFIHTVLHKENRIGFFAELSEKEVRFATGQIRQHSR